MLWMDVKYVSLQSSEGWYIYYIGQIYDLDRLPYNWAENGVLWIVDSLELICLDNSSILQATVKLDLTNDSDISFW
jgi:hypothetical protein